MKFNWGTGIAAVYITFALAMIGFVIKSSQHDVNLVKKNYYDDDINYQTHYDKVKNARSLTKDLNIDLITEGADIALKFPSETPNPTGTVTFFRPSKTGVDQTLDIKVNEQNEMIIPASAFQSGLWKVQVDWQANGKPFYKEQNIIINKA